MSQAAGQTHELWNSEPSSDPAARRAIALARACSWLKLDAPGFHSVGWRDVPSP